MLFDYSLISGVNDYFIVEVVEDVVSDFVLVDRHPCILPALPANWSAHFLVGDSLPWHRHLVGIGKL